MKAIFIVKWIDSYSNSRWYNNKEIKDWIKTSQKELIISVGFLHAKTKKFIALFADESPDEKSRIILIPRGSIKSMKKIK